MEDNNNNKLIFFNIIIIIIIVIIIVTITILWFSAQLLHNNYSVPRLVSYPVKNCKGMLSNFAVFP